MHIKQERDELESRAQKIKTEAEKEVKNQQQVKKTVVFFFFFNLILSYPYYWLVQGSSGSWKQPAYDLPETWISCSHMAGEKWLDCCGWLWDSNSWTMGAWVCPPGLLYSLWGVEQGTIQILGDCCRDLSGTWVCLKSSSICRDIFPSICDLVVSETSNLFIRKTAGVI